jgi:pimeloyl-ACP methyl ester carboxylesterase
LGGVVALNLLAFAQTWTMTHYSPSGTRTPKPEELSLLDKVGAVVMGINVPRPANRLTPDDTGLPYETRYIPATGAGDQWLEAWQVGPVTGTMGIVIMFPGYAASKEALLAQAGAFYRLGWTALLVDFRGTGGSSGSDTTLGAKEAGDVVVALDYARREWPGTKVALYGVSMGAAAILGGVRAGRGATRCAHPGKSVR